MHNQINTSKLESINIEDIITRAEVLLSQSIRRAPAILQIKSGQLLSNICTLGNFSAIKGKAKSKKTFFMTLLMAKCLDISQDTGIIKNDLNGKKVIYIDTEQSNFHVWNVMDRICRLNGYRTQPDNLFGYCLRPFETALRIQLVEKIIYDNLNVGLVVIDGIRDLVKDINSQEEATNTVNMLMKWTHERDIHISLVLHENKGDNNLRGHIGTEVANKSETVISVTKHDTVKNMSIVQADYIRDIDFDTFSFRIDESGLPRINSPEESSTILDF